MNFSLTAMLYATSLMAAAIAGFGVGGLPLTATALSIWRLAFPGDQQLPKWLEYVLVGYVIISLPTIILLAGLLGLDGWSFDPAEYDLAPQVCKWLFAVLAVAPVFLWMKQKPTRPTNAPEPEDVELPKDF